MKDMIDSAALSADTSPGALTPGIVAMANTGRFASAFYNTPLTEYTVGGWDRDPLMELIDFYAPPCPVADRFHYKEARHADDFLHMAGDEDIRPMGGRFARLADARMTEVNERLDEKGLVTCVDRRQIDEDPLAEEKATDRLRRILLRADLLRIINMLDGAAVNANKTWNGSADPDQDVSSELLTAENTVGVRPNRVGYGSAAWSLRQKSLRSQDNAGSHASSTWSPEQLSDFLMVHALAFSESRYRGSNGLATYIGSKVLMFQAAEGATPDDPSNIKRFTGHINGSPMAVFRQEFPHGVEITVAHKSKPRITSTLGIRKLTIS